MMDGLSLEIMVYSATCELALADAMRLHSAAVTAIPLVKMEKFARRGRME
jgi:hypothetical protein